MSFEQDQSFYIHLIGGAALYVCQLTPVSLNSTWMVKSKPTEKLNQRIFHGARHFAYTFFEITEEIGLFLTCLNFRCL
jgi:hypothetical protein